MFVFVFLLVTGIAVGLLSGIIGVGGGLIIVPVLIYLFKYTHYALVPQNSALQTAIASSLLTVGLTASASVIAHYRQRSIRWDLWRRWILGLCLGALSATYVLSMMSTTWLSTCFAIFLLMVAIKFLAQKSTLTATPAHPNPLSTPMSIFLFIAGMVIGLFSGLLGVGGGILMTPLLIRLGCSMPESSGTSSASMLPLALIAGASYSINNPGYVYWPAVLIIGLTGVIVAPIGVKWSDRISIKTGKRILAVLLLVVAIDLLT
ncbi:MAG: sulfite exporter TauE/SafE family protein [Gammaproteobacteria bacterium]|nr:sulfite exporter TauE/SafE family protein [Gammaproteobacteria bacterium]MCD8542017.1 sulfite exporter TauE/SafE family protein [Gammaproteobacteria bacterium]